MSAFIPYYIPWLIASGVTGILFFALLVWGLLTDKDDKKHPEWTNMKFGKKLAIMFGISLLPMFACLATGLFFAVPKYNQAKNAPTATPLPVVDFPGRLLTNTLTEIRPGSAELTYVEHDLPIENEVTNFIRSPKNKYLIILEEEYGNLVDLATWEMRKMNIPVDADSTFSPDEKYLITGKDGNISIEILETGEVYEPIIPRCKEYGLGTVKLAKACLYIDHPIWISDDKFAFVHERGLFDEQAFTFPEEVSVPADSNKTTLGQPNTLTIMDVTGQVILRNTDPFGTSSAEQGDYYLLDKAKLAEGVMHSYAVKFSSNPYDSVETWYGSRPNDPIDRGALNLPSNPMLSPNGKLMLVPPNVVLELETGKVDVLYEPTSYSKNKYTSCVWHPDGKHIACTYFKERANNENDNFIEIITLEDDSRETYPTNLPYTLLGWLE